MDSNYLTALGIVLASAMAFIPEFQQSNIMPTDVKGRFRFYLSKYKTIIIFILGITGAVLGCQASQDQEKTQQLSEAKNDTINAKSDTINMKSDVINAKSDTIKILNNQLLNKQEVNYKSLYHEAKRHEEEQIELKKKSETIAELYKRIALSQVLLTQKNNEIAELDKEIRDNVKGAKNFPFVVLEVPMGMSRPEEGEFFLCLNENYPIDEVRVSIFNADDLKEIKDPEIYFNRSTVKQRISIDTTFYSLKITNRKRLCKVKIEPYSSMYCVYLKSKSEEWYQDIKITTTKYEHKEVYSLVYRLDRGPTPFKKIIIKKIHPYLRAPEHIQEALLNRIDWKSFNYFWDGWGLYLKDQYFQIIN